MMSQRQQAFRAEYRPRISPWYSGLAHVLVIYAIGFAALAYFIPHIHRPSWAEWLVVPVVFLACNGFEWWIHRYVMHHSKPLQARNTTGTTSHSAQLGRWMCGMK